MKRLIAGIVLALIAAAVAAGEIVCVNIAADSTLKSLESVNESILSENPEKAADECTRAIDNWENYGKCIDLFYEGNTVKDVEKQLYKAKYAVYDGGNKFDEIYSYTKKQLVNLKENELPVWNNIL